MGRHDSYSVLCRADIQRFSEFSAPTTLRILASQICYGRGGNPYRKLKAMAADGRTYYGWARGASDNVTVTIESGPLQISIHVGSTELKFSYTGASETVEIHEAEPRRDYSSHQMPQPRPAALQDGGLWLHVEAMIRSQQVRDSGDANRVRRAMALLFHGDVNNLAGDVLARANAYIDQLVPRPL